MLIGEEGKGRRRRLSKRQKVKILWYIGTTLVYIALYIVYIAIYWHHDPGPGPGYLNIKNFVSVSSREKGVWGGRGLTFSESKLKICVQCTSRPLWLNGIENCAGFGLNWLCKWHHHLRLNSICGFPEVGSPSRCTAWPGSTAACWNLFNHLGTWRTWRTWGTCRSCRPQPRCSRSVRWQLLLEHENLFVARESSDFPWNSGGFVTVVTTFSDSKGTSHPPLSNF